MIQAVTGLARFVVAATMIDHGVKHKSRTSLGAHPHLVRLKNLFRGKRLHLVRARKNPGATGFVGKLIQAKQIAYRQGT